ncbi:exodeoxyribonuclease VII small subunit [Actinoalloteichus spitiensis]|uniref:exodeoxyribonuclease VII small subunit n=1 Tax=Actinoalloteichus spitiensis TaxID=252394 RepID=UPI00036BEC09|nr:exodeoxyribonuclease VII small subunit [Actinoalloteichus spitiensis]
MSDEPNAAHEPPHRPSDASGSSPSGDASLEPDQELASLGYEEARDELTAVVRALEAGGLSLERSLELWERGEALARVCERHLAGARERVDRALASVEDTDPPR